MIRCQVKKICGEVAEKKNNFQVALLNCKYDSRFLFSV